MELLKEFDGDAIDTIEQMAPKGDVARGTVGGASDKMKNVPVRGGRGDVNMTHANSGVSR